MEPEAPEPKKKLKAVFISVIILFFVAFCYFDFFGNLLNLYALAAKFAFLLLAYFVLLIYQNITKPKKVGEQIFLAIAVVFLVGLNARDDIKRYNNNVCLEKFGKEFNQRRQSLGIPVIPADWHIDFQGGRSTDWKKKDTTGHYWKMTGVDSLCALEFEDDEYNLKPAQGGSRSMEIATRFAKGKGGDTISFRYDDGAGAKTITRRQADSIFAAEKIQKDY